MNAVCDITEKYFNGDQSISIYVRDAKDAASLSRMLWSWKPESFIPHEIVSSTNDDKISSIRILTEPDVLNPADVLIQHDPLPAEMSDKFQLIIDFAEIYNTDRLQESRQRFKKLRDTNLFDLEFIKLGTFLGR